MLSTVVNAYSTSVALIIATFCDFIAIKIQAGNVSNKILNMQSIVYSFHKLKPLIKSISKVTENKSTHLF